VDRPAAAGWDQPLLVPTRNEAGLGALIDEGEVHLKAGDVVVQQATNHAWVNRGKEPCRIAFILMDSQEP
jgi:hypothetical protein